MPIDRGMDEDVYIHSGISLGPKKNENLPFTMTRMDLESIMQSELS